MRVFVFPLVALSVITGGYNDEPSERDMKTAFEISMAAQVSNALEFVTEAGGPEALDKVREAGSDRFAIRSFRKLDCARSSDTPSYVCAFSVDIELMNGDLQRRMNGRFLAGPQGLVFAEEV
jgi:hypothetical protein